jgi:glutaredoxin 3
MFKKICLILLMVLQINLAWGEKQMAEVLVYTTNYCPFCVKAKNLLQAKNINFKEIDVTGDDQARLELVEKSGGRKTVPQIFINGEAVGGFDDLNKLNENGELEQLIKQTK